MTDLLARHVPLETTRFFLGGGSAIFENVARFFPQLCGTKGPRRHARSCVCDQTWSENVLRYKRNMSQQGRRKRVLLHRNQGELTYFVLYILNAREVFDSWGSNALKFLIVCSYLEPNSDV